MTPPLPTYEIIKVLPDSSVRLIADAEGIAAARLAVETLLREGEGHELEITLEGRAVESGRLCQDNVLCWQTIGRARDLR